MKGKINFLQRGKHLLCHMVVTVLLCLYYCVIAAAMHFSFFVIIWWATYPLKNSIIILKVCVLTLSIKQHLYMYVCVQFRIVLSCQQLNAIVSFTQ